MLFSCKISNSILSDLDQKGFELLDVLAALEVSEEQLREPSSWWDASRMETLLATLDDTFLQIPEGYFRELGRLSSQSLNWGVLDKVLRMMESPQDIFNQPQRFLSYFISPAPPLMSLEQMSDAVKFQIPVDKEQFPYITDYLSGALEGLPSYMGESNAVVEWSGPSVKISWIKDQETLLQDEELNHRHFDPDWVQSIIESLQKYQKSVEVKTLVEGPAELSEDIHQLFENYRTDLDQIYNYVIEVKEDFLKLNDYFSRSQQLITFLVHSGRKTKQVDEAMRRMDWDHVQSSYARMVDSACEKLLSAKEQISAVNYKVSHKQPLLGRRVKKTEDVPPQETLSFDI